MTTNERSRCAHTWDAFAYVALQFGRFVVLQGVGFLQVRLPFHPALRQHRVVAGREVLVDLRIEIRVTSESILVHITANGKKVGAAEQNRPCGS